jgi:hypothetical protein
MSTLVIWFVASVATAAVVAADEQFSFFLSTGVHLSVIDNMKELVRVVRGGIWREAKWAYGVVGIGNKQDVMTMSKEIEPISSDYLCKISVIFVDTWL